MPSSIYMYIHMAKCGTIGHAAATLVSSKTRSVVYINEILKVLLQLSANYIDMPTTGEEIASVCSSFEARDQRD